MGDDEQSSTIVFRKLKNGSETDVERVVVLRTNPLQIEFHMRNKADGFRVDWDMPKSAALSSVEAFVREARRMEGATPSTIGYGITSDPIRDVTSDHLFAATQIAVKEPWRVIGVDQSSCQVQDCAGFLTRKMRLSATGEMVTERITMGEEKGEVTYNKCDASGRPSDVERVLAIRNPLRLEFYERSARSGMRVNWTAPYSMARDTFSNIVQIEFHMRNKADGFRVDWDMPKSAALSSVDAFVREARRMEGATPSTIGYGITSDPIRDVTSDHLFAATELAIKEPWRVIAVDQSSCQVQDCAGFLTRKMRLSASGELVTERITISEEKGEVTYNK